MCEVDDVGTVRAWPSTVRAEYATPLSAPARESAPWGGAALWAADCAGATRLGV